MRLKAELNRGEGLDQVLKNLTELERLRCAFPRPNTVAEPSTQPNGAQLEQKMESMQQHFDHKLEAWLQQLLVLPAKNENAKGSEAAAAAQKTLKEIQSLTERDSVTESLPPVSDSGEPSSDGEAWTKKRKKPSRTIMDTSVSSQGTGIGTDMSSLSQLPQAVEILLAEEARQQRLLLKLREKSRVERTLDELELLQIQKRILRAQGEKEKAVSIKKRQRGLLMKLHEERAEIERLRQMHKKEVENRLRRLQKAQPSSTGTKPRPSQEPNSFSSSWETESSITSVAPPPEASTEVESASSAPVVEELSEVRESIAESVHEDVPSANSSAVPSANSSAVSLPEEKASEVVGSSAVSAKLQVKLKSPLSPRPPGQQAFRTRSRNRYSSGSDESLTFSQTETLSDVSDVEGRVVALTEELKRRQTEAAKLKEDQKKAKRGKLKAQETALLKQIEAYDKLINEVRRELEHETQETSVGVAVKPQIKRPKGKTRPQPKETSEISEDVSNATTASGNLSESLSIVATEESLTESVVSERILSAKDNSPKSLERKATTPESRASDKLPESLSVAITEESAVSERIGSAEKNLPESLGRKVSRSESCDLTESLSTAATEQSAVSKRIVSAEGDLPVSLERIVSTPEARNFPEPLNVAVPEESVPESRLPESLSAVGTEESVSESQEEHIPSEVAVEIIEIAEETSVVKVTLDSSAEDCEPVLEEERSRPVPAPESRNEPEVSEEESSTLTASHSAESASTALAQWAATYVEQLTQTLLQESLASIFALRSPKAAIQLPTDQYSQDATRLVLQRVSALLEAEQLHENPPTSPRSQPASLYTMTYDVISHDWSPPPQSPGSPPLNQEWFDDDLGFPTPLGPPLSHAARLEAQKIEKEKQRIEQEIQQLVSQVAPSSPAPFYREIPNKPPPPYTPPGAWTTPPPKSASKTVGIVQSKEKSLEFCARCFQALLTQWRASEVLAAEFDPEWAELDETEQPELMSAYYHFLFDLTKHFLLEIGSGVTWLPPLAGYTARWRRKERVESEEQLWSVVEQQLAVELHYDARCKKPSRTLKWCHKKRDQVDEVLVYELQAEEREWTDFGLDEQLVKEQTFEAVWEQMLGETVQWLDQLWSQRVLKFLLA